MKNNIKQTLKNKLFDIPRPLIKRELYNELTENMFPYKNDFIDFLTETDSDRVTNLARRIILQFSYENNFFPPAKVIFNLISTESSDVIKESSDYIQNDHFVHKVHLYLLGLYLFFYHDSFHKSIIDKFRNKRYNLNNKSLVLFEVIEDVIEAWKFFVFFHDIGYPIELFLGTNSTSRDNQNIYNKYLKSFNEIKKSIEKDLSVKLFTNLISYNSILNHSTFKNFENVVLNYDNELELHEYKKAFFDKDNFPLEIKQSRELDKIFGKFSLRLVLSFVERKNIICVLKRKSLDEPLIIVMPHNDNSYKIYLTNYCPRWKLSNNKIIESAYNNTIIKNDYYWSYYCIESKDVFNNFEQLEKQKFEEISNVLLKNIPNNFDIISNENEFKSFSFELYYSINEALKLFNENYENLSKLQLFYKTREPIFLSVVEDLPEIISVIFKKLLKSSFKETFNLKSIKNEKEFDLYKVILESLKNLTGSEDKERINILTHLFNDNIESSIVSKINSHINVRSVWTELRKNIESKIEDSQINVSFKQSKHNEKTSIFSKDLFETNNLFNVQKEFINDLEKKLKENGLGNLDDAIKYRPAYMDKENREIGYDHGIVSALIAIDIINIHEQIYYSSNSDNILKFASLYKDFEHSTTDITHIKNVLLESVYAIFTHNIYPKDFHKNFRTKIKNTPFVYLCILADSLQPWDRKKSIDFAKRNLPYTVVSNQFNIEVLDNKVYISEEGNKIDLEKRYKSLKTYLNDYLENASDLIRTSLREL